MARVCRARRVRFSSFFWCSLLVLGFVFSAGPKLSAEEIAGAISGSETTNVSKVISGPWGDLQYFEVTLIAPKWIAEMFELPSTDPIWRFPGWSAEQVSQALGAMPFTPQQFGWTKEPNRVLILEDEVRLHPPGNMILGMNSDQRRAIHHVLSQWEENTFHHQPIVIRAEESRTWFRSVGLSGEIAELIASLCFEDHGNSIFTEVEFVMKQLGSRESEYKFIRSLTRTHGLIGRLRITDQSDLDAIANYWRGYGKRKSIAPIMEAVAMTRGVDHLDILHLLPPIPRKLLNTYPDIAQSRTGKFPDSQWVAANFFRFDPSSRFLNANEVSREIETMYRVVEDESRFGDLLVITRENEAEPLQMAIQIAGDIVYTKNGDGIFSPFILTTMPEVLRANAKDERKLLVKTLRHVMAE